MASYILPPVTNVGYFVPDHAGMLFINHRFRSLRHSHIRRNTKANATAKIRLHKSPGTHHENIRSLLRSASLYNDLVRATAPQKNDKLQNYRISFNFRFCSAVNEVGNLTLYLTMKLPRLSGVLLSGIPRLG